MEERRAGDKALPFSAALSVKCPTPTPPQRSVTGATAARRASALSAAPPRFDKALQEKTAEIKEILEVEVEEKIHRKYEREYVKRLKSEIKSR